MTVANMIKAIAGILALVLAFLALLSEEWRNDIIYKLGLYTATPSLTEMGGTELTETVIAVTQAGIVPGTLETSTLTPSPSSTSAATQNSFSMAECTSKSFAFVSDRDGNAEIYFYAESGEIFRLTQDEAEDVSPRWFRNGEEIAFISDRFGRRQIMRLRVDGSNPSPEFWNVGVTDDIVAFDILLDTMVFVGVTNGKTILYHFNNGNAVPMVLSESITDLDHPTLSPDGQFVAFQARPQLGSNYDIYVLELRGSLRLFNATLNNQWCKLKSS